MPHLLFSAVLRMSAAASGAILAVLLARLLLSGRPKSFPMPLGGGAVPPLAGGAALWIFSDGTPSDTCR